MTAAENPDRTRRTAFTVLRLTHPRCQAFKAEYVLCALEALNRQVHADPARFMQIPGSELTGPIRISTIKD